MKKLISLFLMVGLLCVGKSFAGRVTDIDSKDIMSFGKLVYTYNISTATCDICGEEITYSINWGNPTVFIGGIESTLCNHCYNEYYEDIKEASNEISEIYSDLMKKLKNESKERQRQVIIEKIKERDKTIKKLKKMLERIREQK